jgi:hypothetical protein
MKYFGLYQVLEKIGEAAYKLELPEHKQVHPVFHVSQIKPYTTDYVSVFQPSSLLPQLDLLDLEPEAVLDRRLSKKGNSAVVQVLVKWSSLPLEMVTWEDYHVIIARIAGAAAWGQARASTGSIDTQQSVQAGKKSGP